jgi:hypothetical protein
MLIYLVKVDKTTSRGAVGETAAPLPPSWLRPGRLVVNKTTL